MLFISALVLALAWTRSGQAGELAYTTAKVCQVTGTEDLELPGNPTGAQLAGVTGAQGGKR